ncbi:DUF4136 domain-containing protein [Altererythrobacter sp. Root672]|uniref:DUF4136 domain-containing protein n=1 Tax=Altererythrobacter sp. Root672 TaxID=1736584 RepID=UPI0006F21657|nr:DUF4136 domain-containing protein [Altererythrobacter sp. Root672]KRA81274.1 lipoprotein transmembrane [Altererythrobacter sp. Root672]
MSNLSEMARHLRLILVPLALAALAACTTPFKADVSRFESQLPAPAGQTFYVAALDPALEGGIEFRTYAQLVTNHLTELGYRPVTDRQGADLIVSFDYGVDNGRERIRSTGFSDPWGSWYGYRPGWRGGFYGSRGGPWGWGWNSAFFNDVYSYTVFTSGVDLKIDRAADGVRLFEGNAQALSTSNRLQYLVPNLVDAMFVGFPGNSGETVRISIAPEKQTASRD